MISYSSKGFYKQSHNWICRCIFRVLSNIYDGEFLRRCLTTKSGWLFSLQTSSWVFGGVGVSVEWCQLCPSFAFSGMGSRLCSSSLGYVGSPFQLAIFNHLQNIYVFYKFFTGAFILGGGLSVRQSLKLSYAIFIINNQASFHLWWKENLVNHQQVSKYYKHDCSLAGPLDL